MGRNFRNRQNMRIKSTTAFDNKDTIIKLLIVIILLLIVFILYYITNNEKKFSQNISTSLIEEERVVVDVSDDFIEEDVDVLIEENIEEDEIFVEESSKETSTTFKLAVVGNIACPNDLLLDTYVENSYDFSYLFENIQYYTRTADLTIGTLSTNFTNNNSAYNSFNSPSEFSSTLKKIGFDVLSTANNHALDYGYSGLEETIDIIDDSDILHTGTNLSSNDQNSVVYKYIKGIKIGFVSYTYQPNSMTIPADKDYCINIIDEELILAQLDSAKDAGCELIIANINLSSSSTSTIDFLFENGADIVLGTNSDKMDKIEIKEIIDNDGNTKNCFFINSLGDFIDPSNMSIILNLSVTKNLDGTFLIDTPTYTPIFLDVDSSKSLNSMSFIDVSTKIAEYDAGAGTIDSSLYDKFKTAINTINSLLGI